MRSADRRPRRDGPGRPAGRLARHGRRRPARRRPDHHAGRLAAGPPRREDPAGRRDEQRARRRPTDQVAGRAEHDRRAARRGAGVAIVLYGAAMGGSDGQAPMGVGAVLLIIGVFVLTPLLSRPLIAAGAPAAAGLRGLRQARPAERRAQPAPHRRHRLRADDRPDPDHRHDGDRRAACSRPSTRWPPTRSRPTTWSRWPTAAPSPRTSAKKPAASRRASPPSRPLRNAASRIGGETEYLTGVNGADIGEAHRPRLRRRLVHRSAAREVVVDDEDRRSRHGWKAGSARSPRDVRGRQEAAS